MNNVEKNAVKIVAKLSPWLAPLPSAYFVARSAMVHLALPLLVAVVVAAIIETLGLATVHTALWAYEWNAHKRKTDPGAPMALAIALGSVYVIATLGLVVFLEVWPVLAAYAPALFPALAVVGALNLAMISRQEQREATIKAAKAERQAARQARRQTARQAAAAQVSEELSNTTVLYASLDVARQTRQAKRDARLTALVAFYESNPDAGPTEAGRAIGVSRQTVYAYLAELEEAGRISRNDGRRIEVLTKGGDG
jgi:DNA-binding MarR family transcriptional regulator